MLEINIFLHVGLKERSCFYQRVGPRRREKGSDGVFCVSAYFNLSMQLHCTLCKLARTGDVHWSTGVWFAGS